MWYVSYPTCNIIHKITFTPFCFCRCWQIVSDLFTQLQFGFCCLFCIHIFLNPSVNGGAGGVKQENISPGLSCAHLHSPGSQTFITSQTHQRHVPTQDQLFNSCFWVNSQPKSLSTFSFEHWICHNYTYFPCESMQLIPLYSACYGAHANSGQITFHSGLH